MPLLPQASKKKKTFVIVTKDFSGLGFALKLKNEGSNVLMVTAMTDEEDKTEEFKKIGDGLILKLTIEKARKIKNKLKHAYWIWDANHNTDFSEELRKEGFTVLGGDEFSDKMEHDRAYATQIVHKAGIKTPETFEFSDAQAGIAFLQQHEDTAFVFKPDQTDEKMWKTTVPDSDKPEAANKEIQLLLEASGGGNGSYVLQEKKSGVEFNIECFVYEGKPFFAHINFESKRRLNGDLGELAGCSQDIEHVVDINSPILEETVYKLLKLPEYKKFTGFVDGNFIKADNDFWYLEACQRFGYNAHPNLFLSCAISPLSVIFSDWLDRKIYDFYKHFRRGFGASVSIFIENPIQGIPIMIPDELMKLYHAFDLYKEDDILRLSGYSKDVGIICAHDYDLKSAADEALRNIRKIHFSDKAARTDLNQCDYPSNPSERFTAIREMKLI